ncbi:uncharacterized protein CDAR_453061 [Caerostris darwini]|uniref:CCHC-type domain-containing protein n=1 Tax=Caerostris darwini TaxID=1538125 RepID=A0AAV4VCF4_9ARAC|nr:uncharacterized protein CDAR_453061 [Caerostris darwini]
MDNMLEELLPPADLLKGISYNADDTLKVALGYYKNILYLADKKDIRSDSRTAFRDNAMGLLSLLQSQTIKMAQLQGRLTELEKSKDAEESSILALVEGRMTDMERNLNDKLRSVQHLPPPILPIPDKPSFSAIVKATPALKNQPKQAPKQRKQHLAVIKPKDENSNSSDTKTFIQKSVDINSVQIGVKRVSNVRKGGILIETVDDKDLDKLIRELDSNPDIKEKFDFGKPIQRNPQIICFGVSNETTEATVANCIKLHCSLDESSTDIKILHSFKGARGRNWIIESTPEVFKTLSKATKISIGWERISYKEYVRPRQCFKCCKFGHLAKHCQEPKDLCTNCGNPDHTWKDCKAAPKCVNCSHNNQRLNTKTPTNHSCTSKECPTYQKEIKFIISKTNYGQ